MRPRIAAFGASREDLPEARYREVAALAEALGAMGFDGLVGGHQGMMAAFAEGIRAGGGRVRGITLERFPTPPGNALAEEVRARDFFERMRMLIEQAHGYLVLPGGIGTLAELAMAWDLIAIRVLEPRPLVLFGEEWRAVVDALLARLWPSTPRAAEVVSVCADLEEALARFRPLAAAASG